MSCLLTLILSDVWLLDSGKKVEINPLYGSEIRNYAENLMNSCQTISKVENIPKCDYKGLGFEENGRRIEFHITPNSLNSMTILIYVQDKRGNYLLGKYTEHHLAVICMIESLLHQGRKLAN